MWIKDPQLGSEGLGIHRNRALLFISNEIRNRCRTTCSFPHSFIYFVAGVFSEGSNYLFLY